MDPIFQKTLQDLVKGIRSHKKDPNVSTYISQAIVDIKNELKSTDPYIKAEAVRKLTYLQMFGYNISWASFSIVEVMSLPKFAHKRIGYLAANQSFTDSTDVILLTTNLFKKELSSSSMNQYEIGLAINSLANIANKDLARDCMSDLVVMMNHTRPYVRKKAVLAMFKLYIKFPQGLRLTFEKLKDRLDDTENCVISCAVNVICELANKNPNNYLSMAPKFFRLLTSSSNNWMLIKVVKLMGSLVPEEPRLARKLLEPLATIIQNTGAKSLQYECIHTITEALMYTKREDGSDAKNAPAIVKLCSDYLKGFVEDSDQNLKYLGLVGLVNLMESNPRSVVEHRDLILRCLFDEDVTIRVKALELLVGIVSKKSLVDLVDHLLEHANRSEGSFRDEIIAKVLWMCSQDKFSLISDFAWYVSVLVDLAVVPGSKHGKEVSDQLIEVAIRVEPVRPFAVESMLSILLNDALVLGPARQTVYEVLKAAAWITGEYSDILNYIANDVYDDDAVMEDDELGFWIEGPCGDDLRSSWRGQNVHILVLEALLHPRSTNLPVHVQTTYLQAAMKIFIKSSVDRDIDEIATLIGIIRSYLGVFLQSHHMEVQERASSLRYLLSDFDILPLNWQENAEEVESTANESESKTTDLLDFHMPVYTDGSIKKIDESGATIAKRKAYVMLMTLLEPILAVHPKAQRKVPPPEDLNLDLPLNQSALNKISALEIPSDISMSSLVLIKASNTSVTHPTMQDPWQKNDDDSPFPSNGKSSYSLFGEDTNFAKTINSHLQNSNPFPNRNPEESLFYLSKDGKTSKDDVNIIPLSQKLAESFNDKKSKRSNHRHGKSSSSKKRVDTREILPAGAVSSDEDEYLEKKSSHRRQKTSSTRKSDSLDPSEDLGSVDITTPLREDEVFEVPKHREVPSSMMVRSEENDHGKTKSSKESKKDKKKGKEKEKSSKSEKSQESEKKKSKSKEQAKAVSDLLDFDWKQQDSSSTSHGERGNSTSSMVSSPPVNGRTVGPDELPSSPLWLPLWSDNDVESSYFVHNRGGSLVSLYFMTRNLRKNSHLSIEAIMSSSSSAWLSFSNFSVSLCRRLAYGDESIMVVDKSFSSSNIHGIIDIDISLHVRRGDSLLDSDGVIVHASKVTLFPSASFSYLSTLSVEQFATLMGGSDSSRWVHKKITLPYSLKWKHAIRALVSIFQGVLVDESNVWKAGKKMTVSIYTKTALNDHVCILAKPKSDKNDQGQSLLSLDIKCSSLKGSEEGNMLLQDILNIIDAINI